MLDEVMENYDETLEKYISSIDNSIRTEKEEYERRIILCSNCDELLNGVCKLCGCFVKARAAKKSMSCPSSHPKWQRLE
jgi:hypothetical protein